LLRATGASAGYEVAQQRLRAPFFVDEISYSCFVLIMEHKGWHNRGYLHHFDAKGVVQHVVLCTKQALPRGFLDTLTDCDPSEKRKLIDQALDASHSGSLFEAPICASALKEQLLYFDGDRYDLLA
jgi:putative transposase